MGAVCGNSKVTIAAVKSEDGHGGCLDQSDKIEMFTLSESSALRETFATRKLVCQGEGYQY
jgi:hypothetical protein